MPLHSKKLKSSAEVFSMENHNARERVDALQKELALLAKEKEDLLIQLRETETGLDQKTDVQVEVVKERRDSVFKLTRASKLYFYCLK